MISYSESSIDKISVHHVGNKSNDESLILSKSELATTDDRLKELLMRFFLSPFSSDEYYSFTFTNEDFTLNPLYTYASRVFTSLNSFHADSIDIAKHLFEVSDHPAIKEGDLFVVHFTDMVVVDEIVPCIGIFKSENKHAFLKLDQQDSNFILNYEDGINIEKLDKGCLIFNTDAEQGYKVAIIDKSSKSDEAHFWRDRFLQLKNADDNFHRTKNFLTMAKSFVVKQIPPELEVGRVEKMELLNRSFDYFQKNENFNRAEFEDDVLQDDGLIRSFREYNDNLSKRKNVAYLDEFEISSSAVQKQSKMVRHVIKLDMNFHIYVHGNQEMIVQGEEKSGRKYYKLYYDRES